MAPAALGGPFPVLLRACADGDVAKLTALLDAGASPNVCNGIGQSGLHLAAMWGHAKIAELLLEAGAEVSIANEHGVTPLHYAAQKGKYAVARLLLAAGADKAAKSKNGLAPYEGATEDAMRQLCGGPTLELHTAVEQQDVEHDSEVC